MIKSASVAYLLYDVHCDHVMYTYVPVSMQEDIYKQCYFPYANPVHDPTTSPPSHLPAKAAIPETHPSPLHSHQRLPLVKGTIQITHLIRDWKYDMGDTV